MVSQICKSVFLYCPDLLFSNLDATTMSTYSHTNTPLSQSVILSYFINHVNCLYGFCLFRPVNEICGFSREMVVAVTTNIEITWNFEGVRTMRLDMRNIQGQAQWMT